jgi:hypothetical protein
MAATVVTVDEETIESLVINDCANCSLQHASKWYV